MKKLILLISFIALGITTQATVHVVDSLNDAGIGSLRSKIALASNGDTIRFNPNLIANGSDSIVLSSEIAFSKSLVFKGLYNTTDTLFLASNGSERLFNLTNIDSLQLDSIVIGKGKTPPIYGLYSGGAILLQDCDSIIINNSIFKNSRAWYGGAIRALNSPLFVSNSMFINNYALGNGGAISTNNWSQQSDSTILELIECVFFNNYAQGNGGAVNFLGGDRPGNLKVTNCVYTNNFAFYGGALGIGETGSTGVSFGDLIFGVIKGSFFENNTGVIYGGGIYSTGHGLINIDKSLFLENRMDTTLGYSGGRGGAIFGKSNGRWNLVLNRSTLTRNYAEYGAGIHVRLYADTSSLQIINSTIYENESVLGGVLNVRPLNLPNTICNTSISGSIVANNGDTTFASTSNLPLQSNGYNIFSDTNGVSMQSTDILDTSHTLVNLGPLLPNGGTLPSLMPMPPSIAINAGNPTDLSDAKNAPINGVRDIGAVEYCAPSFHSDTIVACSEFTWVNGITYFQSDTVINYTLVSASGCDSIMSLYLTINQPSISHDTIIACDNYTWMDGNTYYISNHTAQHVVTNSVGCDSTIYLHLTITNAIVEKFSVCDSLVWRNGITYYQSNNSAQDTVFTTGICDSIFHLDLTVHQKEYSTQTISACNNYTWSNGITYTSSINTPKDTLVNRFGCDSIVTLDLTIIPNVHDTESVSGCLFYTWSNGQIYLSDNNTATQVFNAANGCDSILHLDLQIHQGTFAIDTHVVCDSLVWIDGNTYYTNNNTAMHTLSGANSHGCDSVVTLNLTINSSQTTDVISSCGAYTWVDGNTYTSNNNTATHTFTNALGCDSIVTLDLTINGTTYGTETVVSCDSYTWNGITYTSSNNTATDTLVNSNGCDSIVTLDLTILQSTTFIDVIASCDAITWLDGNTYAQSNNTATHTLSNAAGCDSVITLNFTLLQSTTATDAIASCSEITWIDGNVYNASTSGPTFTIPNAAGCDSVVTLNFTLLEVDTAVTRNYLTLTAQATNATYQWIDCTNGILTGETNAAFTATQNGNYQVEVTQNGCVDTSACFSITNVGIQQAALLGVNVYPNPTSDVLHIDKGSNASLEITVTNSAGAVVYNSSTQDQITTINMAKMASGVYLITLRNESGLKVERVVKR